jgi:hypothetical protein
VCVLVSLPVSVKLRRMRKEEKMLALRQKADGVRDAIKALQKGYFEDGTVGKKTYVSMMEKHRKELAALSEAIAAGHG